MHTYHITCNTLLHRNRLIRSWRRRRPFRDCSKCIGGSENCPGITVAATRRYYKPQAMAMNCILRLSKAGAVPDHRQSHLRYVYIYIHILYIYIYIIDILYTHIGNIYTPKNFGKMNLSLTCGPSSCCRSCRPLAPGSDDFQRSR